MVPRMARKRSASGIYHVILRGINRQEIFYDETDYRYFIDVLRELKSGEAYVLHAYSLMGNHVHLLMQEKTQDLISVMKRLGIRYAFWYNKRYKRVGHVFQDRYRSEPVEDDAYFLTVARYIHQNPLKAGLAESMEQYLWSSYSEYCGKQSMGVADCKMLLGMLGGVAQFKSYMEEETEPRVLEYEKAYKMSDEQVYEMARKLLRGREIGELNTLDKKERDAILRQMKEQRGVNQRQIARVTGLGENVIFKA